VGSVSLSHTLLWYILLIKVSFSGPHYFEDLVDIMYDNISESLNADFEDGSVEEVIISPSVSCLSLTFDLLTCKKLP
jgi:hypothetical protein